VSGDAGRHSAEPDEPDPAGSADLTWPVGVAAAAPVGRHAAVAGPWQAAVLGSPIAHSLSPVIHNAGYAAAGLADWAYSSHEVGEAELAGFVAELGPQWAGLSLTMPLKEVALAVAEQVAPLATVLGAANTLVRLPSLGWYADNTDAPGMVDALRSAGVSTVDLVAVLGAGGTARAALAAAAELGATTVHLYVRRQPAGEALRTLAERLGLALRVQHWPHAPEARNADLVISTVPKGVADDLGGVWNPKAALFDVVYDPWPTRLAITLLNSGGLVVSGLDLLLAQAARQFTLFTGVDAPVEAMGAALHAAADARRSG
jgi:shikimate dehydrogenase